MNLEPLTALLDFYSVAAALVTSIGGKIRIRGGRNAWEKKHDENASNWNKLFDFAFYAAFVTAAISLSIKTYPYL